MSQKDIRIFDDTVLKLSVKQGTEKERFNVTDNVGTNGIVTHANGTNIKIDNFESMSAMPGAFTSGELAYTRDTNRLFVGNISEETNKKGSQQTFGGVLTGNKYLGYIDSKAPYNSANNGIALSLDNTVDENNNEVPGLLTEGSSFRSYEFVDSNTQLAKSTSDKNWSRFPYYNSKYDAYDGDYMYDIYRNALILFDHNIKPNDETTGPTAKTNTAGGRRRTPIKPREDLSTSTSTTSDPALESVTRHTKDMYGDGYVLLYNVIPDGTSLTFVDRSFNEDSGECDSPNDSLKNNFSYNIIKVNKVGSASIKDAFNTEHFECVQGGNISLHPDIVANLGTSFKLSQSPKENAILVIDANKKIVDSQYSTTLLSKLDVLGNKTLAEYIDSKLDINTITKKIISDVKASVEASMPSVSTINNLSNKVTVLENKINGMNLPKDDDLAVLDGLSDELDLIRYWIDKIAKDSDINITIDWSNTSVLPSNVESGNDPYADAGVPPNVVE